MRQCKLYCSVENKSCSSLLEIKDKIYNSDMSIYSDIESCLLIWVISKRGHNSNSILDDFNIFFKKYWMSSAGNIVQHYLTFWYNVDQQILSSVSSNSDINILMFFFVLGITENIWWPYFDLLFITSDSDYWMAETTDAKSLKHIY